MKLVITSILVLFTSTLAFAQDSENNDKVDTFKVGVVLVTGTPSTIPAESSSNFNEQVIARLYRYPNSRVKKALSFRAKKDRPKLA
ncbi:hypothetical protein [Maribacter sp. R77961]|uniref:hypothetical protein n=1 Tax=Maribacter sp. R77961 TaxID=3093871 RepID=UPI0037C8166A